MMEMTPILSLSHVSKGYWRGSIHVSVLRDVSLDLTAGDFVAVWGGLKAGKTTLLEIAAGRREPDAGGVHVCGVDLALTSDRAMQRLWRHEIGLAQRRGPHERELSMLDYVAFPLFGTMSYASAQRRAMEAIQELGVDTACAGLRWDELTDGERSLVAIAHAIVREPSLLLVDDPTSSLGVDERERTIALLRRLAVERRMAVLMTAPDMAATLGAQEVFTLTSGELRGLEPWRRAAVIPLPGA
jgi:putative ABC transport system ATP-binding protein